MFKTKGGGAKRLFEQCSKKTADLVKEGTPNTKTKTQEIPRNSGYQISHSDQSTS